jgi:hypothetical protein
LPVSLKIAYRSYKQIAQVAAESLEKFGCEYELPVPIEHIIIPRGLLSNRLPRGAKYIVAKCEQTSWPNGQPGKPFKIYKN